VQRAIIFDYGGVLMKTVDYEPRHRWDKRLGLPSGTVERIVHGSESWHKAMAGQITVEAYWDNIASQLNLSPYDIQALAADFYAGDRLDTTLIDEIKQLKQAGHAVALLSNASTALMDELKALQIAHLFDPLVISAYIGVTKPERAAYEAVLERLQRPADETIFIDDMPANIIGAAQVGINALQYHNGMSLKKTLAPLLKIE